jgi:hypothetical protein
MRPGIYSLLPLIASNDAAAISTVIMLLEWSNAPRESGDWYREFLGTFAEYYPVPPEEQREIVDQLSSILRSDGTLASIPWALSCATPQVGLSAVLDQVTTNWAQLSDEARHQCLVGLRDLLRYGENELPEPELMNILQRHNPTNVVASAVGSPCEGVSQIAEILTPELAAYLGGGRRRGL